MKLIGTIHRFNTGRYYSADHQPITWAVVERPTGTRCVVFVDHARGISGTIPLHVGNLDLLTDAWVLRAYDDFHYDSSGWSAEVQFLLTEATRA
jgi:hypothetical protein